MTTVFCDPDHNTLSQSMADRKVALYNTNDFDGEICSTGNNVRHALARYDLSIPTPAFDFLTIALSIVAADEFVSRADAPYGFARDISLTVSLAKPTIWNSQKAELQKILTFLTGDDWSLSFKDGGLTPPAPSEKRRLRSVVSLSNIEKVCLFSGGLDSLVGAINELDSSSDSTLLVSRASKGDSKHQKLLLNKLGMPPHFGVNDSPSRPSNMDWKKEDSTRARSILFLALGACFASAISSSAKGVMIPLIIPENGFIALNPPLSPRRRGSLSTRTAHPHYLNSLQNLFDDVGINAHIQNPFSFQTKGELITKCSDVPLANKLAKSTVSCGKWKRRNQQCGKCVPCLIRRSSLFAAGIKEPKNTYEQTDLASLSFSSKNSADLAAVIIALKSVKKKNLPQWVSVSGPLTTNQNVRKKYYDVAWRGLREMRSFLMHSGIKL